jgi:hypothetical protein
MMGRLEQLLVWVSRILSALVAAQVTFVSCFLLYVRVACGQLLTESGSATTPGAALDQVMRVDRMCLNESEQPLHWLRFLGSAGLGLVVGSWLLVVLVRRGIPRLSSSPR